MTDTSYTHISFLLDRSGSMSSTKRDTIGGFNEFLQSQLRDNTGKTTCSLTTFNYDIVNVYSMVDLNQAEPLTEQNYVPQGGTALFDAWIESMLTLSGQIAGMAPSERPEKTLFVVLTDGEENSSRHYTNIKHVNDMIASHSDWEFIYLGANQDAIKEGGRYGIGNKSAITYKQGAEANAYRCLSDAVSRYRKGKSKNVEFTKCERSLSMEPSRDSTLKGDDKSVKRDDKTLKRANSIQ